MPYNLIALLVKLMIGMPEHLIGYRQQTQVNQMQIQFIEANPATHFGIDAEDIQEIVEFDSTCDQLWPIWVMKKCGHPVAWYCEAQEVACVIR